MNSNPLKILIALWLLHCDAFAILLKRSPMDLGDELGQMFTRPSSSSGTGPEAPWRTLDAARGGRFEVGEGSIHAIPKSTDRAGNYHLEFKNGSDVNSKELFIRYKNLEDGTEFYQNYLFPPRKRMSLTIKARHEALCWFACETNR